MRLREFDLDLPQRPRARHRFRTESRCVTALYERCFPGLQTTRTWKVLVECVDEVEYEGVIDLLGVAVVQQRFDWRAYRTASTHRRKEIILAALHAGALRAAEIERWRETAFERAKAAVVELDYTNEWTWPTRPKLSPDRRHKAQLRCVHGMNVFRASLVILDRRGCEIAVEPAFASEPSEFAFVRKMGRLTWTSARRVVLRERKYRGGREIAAASVPRDG